MNPTPIPVTGKRPSLPVNPPAPYPGQESAEIKAWFDAKYPGGLTKMSARTYARALYKTKPERDDDPGGEAEWYARLTEFQRNVLEAAKRQRNADPKVRAADNARRKADPAYQTDLVKKRAEYADKVQAKTGREVRAYRRSAKLSADDKKAERRSRNEAMRARIRDELAAGRNPFELSRYGDEAKSDANLQMKCLICYALLATGEFDTVTYDPVVEKWAKESGLASDELRKLIAGAVEILRTAKAIRKSGDKIHLRKGV